VLKGIEGKRLTFRGLVSSPKKQRSQPSAACTRSSRGCWNASQTVPPRFTGLVWAYRQSAPTDPSVALRATAAPRPILHR
jgi:hypothetical protein